MKESLKNKIYDEELRANINSALLGINKSTYYNIQKTLKEANEEIIKSEKENE